MLNYANIKAFVLDMARAANKWPVMDQRAWDALPEREQLAIREELNALLCALERHDYEFKLLGSEGVVLQCIYCGQEKLCSLRGEG